MVGKFQRLFHGLVAPGARPSSWSYRGILTALFFLVTAGYIVMSLVPSQRDGIWQRYWHPRPAASLDLSRVAKAELHPILANDSTTVPVDFFVMSRCPDALYCEKYMYDVLKPLSSIVTPRYHYIARLSQGKGGQTRVRCMHGAKECQANMEQLCVAKEYDYSAAHEFIHCQDQSPKRLGDPALAKQCATDLGLDYDHKLQFCLVKGVDLLAQSAQFAIDSAVK
ncbi:hypothetical protein H4R35_006453 [Dimargaris xerosporica]|nr:hypothetical protein H4R35_006453 [Dimargaris xerosporica]